MKKLVECEMGSLKGRRAEDINQSAVKCEGTKVKTKV